MRDQSPSTGDHPSSPARIVSSVATARSHASRLGRVAGAAGDGTFVFAPFALGIVTDALPNTPGAECAVAGGATILGVVGLATLGANYEGK